MSFIAFPVLVAVLLSIVIPMIVGAAVRRSDRNDRSMTRPNPDTGALFIVTNRRWQSVLFRVLGIAFLVIGGFFTLVSVVESEEMDGPGPLISAAAITVAGALFVVLAMGIRRFRVDAYDSHLTVRPWFRAMRVVPLTEIGSVRPSLTNFGGVDVKDANGRMLFTATKISSGYDDIVAYLQERSPLQQTPNSAAPTDTLRRPPTSSLGRAQPFEPSGSRFPAGARAPWNRAFSSLLARWPGACTRASSSTYSITAPAS